LKASCQ